MLYHNSAPNAIKLSGHVSIFSKQICWHIYIRLHVLVNVSTLCTLNLRTPDSQRIINKLNSTVVSASDFYVLVWYLNIRIHDYKNKSTNSFNFIHSGRLFPLRYSITTKVFLFLISKIISFTLNNNKVIFFSYRKCISYF